MSVELKVGQVWKTRGGEVVVVGANDDQGSGCFPFKANGRSLTYTKSGHYAFSGDPSCFDLIELIQDADETQAARSINRTPRRHSHYFKDVSQINEIDVYRVCELFGVDDPSGATQHAVKKLLCAGQRGAKDRAKDYQEAIDTLTRRVEMWAEGQQ